MVYGTPAYMAPEQALGQPVDGRADLYAVGVLLFEMLTGKRPFRHENMATLLGLQVTAPVPTMAEAAPDVRVPAAVEAVTRRLMAKDPAQRFATAEELEAALEKSIAVVLPADPPAVEKLLSPVGVPDLALEHRAPGTLESTKGLPEAGAVTRVDTPARSDVAPVPMLTPQPAAAPRVPRRHWLLGGGAVILLGFLASLAIPRSEPAGVAVAPSAMGATEPSAVASVSAAPPPPPSATPEPAPEDTLAKPLASAEAALAKNEPSVALGIVGPLEAANPNRADVHRILERAYAMTHERVAALREAEAWLVNDPTAAADLSLQTDIGEIATHPTTSDAAILLLASRLGAPGVDILYDLAFASKQRPTVAGHAAAMLEKAEVRSHAGPAAAVLLDLRAATTCEARRALLPRVKSDGDRRALAILKPWTTNRKEAGCMRHDPDLANAIQAVSGRSGML
jgi:serine/threonine-protein kinase